MFLHETRLTKEIRDILSKSAIEASRLDRINHINFHLLWELLYKNLQLRCEINALDNPYQHNWEEQLLLVICRFFLINKIRFTPSISYFGTEPIKEGDLLLNFHFGLSPLAYYVNSQSIHYCVVSDYPKAVSISFALAGLYKLSNHVISRDQKVFVKIKESLKSHLVSCTVDFRENSLTNFNSVSPAIFKFINLISVDAKSLAYRVREDGSIEIHSSKLIGKDDKSLIDKFIAHQYSIRPHLNYSIREFDLAKQKKVIGDHVQPTNKN